MANPELDALIIHENDMHRQRYRAFQDYRADYEKALKKWPEFQEEYDMKKLKENNGKP